MVGNPASSQQREFLWLLVWIVVGVLAGGGLGWGLSQSAAPQATTIGLVFGAAIGGGFSAVVRLFASGESDPQQPEAVTVEMDDDADSAPDPQPADLFEGSPDPILYFDATGEGPVVRAANPAFETTFGVGTDAVANAALADALMTTDRTEDVVETARAGESFDAVLSCETGEQTLPFRVRTVTVDDATGTRGYVLYTPVERTG